MRITRRQFILAFAVATGALLLVSPLHATEENDQSWNEIRKFLFKDQPILENTEIIRVDAPIRPDVVGTGVPVKIISNHPQNDDSFIQKYYLVVDKNPAPIAAEFNLSPQGSPNVGTEIRINEYSYVRVVAQANDGTLYMDKTMVKTTVGCSAPPITDADVAKLMMGKTELRQESTALGDAQRFRISITHPSYTGMQRDQLTTFFIPPHYVETVEVTNKSGEQVFFVKGDISFSENPVFNFEYDPQDDDALKIKVIDSRKQIYETDWPLTRT